MNELLKTMHLLLIDDDEVDRRMVQRVLQKAELSFTCREVPSCAEALKAVCEESFDCILVDYLLPDGDGLSLVRQLRNLGITTPLVALTGQGDEKIAVELMKAGVSDYLTKDTITASSLTQVLISTQRLYRAELQAQKATQDLRESEERYRLVIDGCNDGIWDWDVRNKKIHVSDRLLNILGIAAFEEFGNNTVLRFYRLVHPQDRALTRAALRQDQDYHLELRVQHSSGDYRYCQCRGGSQWDAQGNLVRSTGILGDISVRKWLEAEREQLLIRERQARQDAEAANRLKDEFLAMVSHELRTPLNAILGWTQILQRNQLEFHQIHSALETIEQNARAQNHLIEDLLDVSRIITGKMRLTPIPVTFNPIIEQAIEVVRPTALTKSIQLQTILPTLSPVVLGDFQRLQQVLWNLLVNAIRFTPPEGQVTVTLKAVSAQLVLAVQDTGEGISPEFLPYVFERFRQADGTATRHYGGLGLGLAIVRHLVELHGGNVEAKSPGLGQGATFIVKLPMVTSG